MNQNDQSYIDLILYKKFFETLNQSEEEYLQEWLSESRSNIKLIESIGQVMRTEYHEPSYINASSMINKILDEGFERTLRKEKTYYSSWMKVAASLFLVTTFSLIFYLISNSPDSKPEVAEQYIVKENPIGVKSRIFLSDSSIVWLNADSKLTYVQGFSDTLRFLELVGEACFEVNEDKARPFIVKSGNVQTRALGTSFNIRHYPDEANTEVSLLTGKVSIRAQNEFHDKLVYLEPFQDLTISRDIETVTMGNMNGNEVTAWKDNILKFQNASFKEVMKTLERWYGVEISYQAYSRTKWNYNAEFRNQSLERVLSRMGYSQNFEFELINKQITLYD